jgi:predicted transcriptional regulator
MGTGDSYLCVCFTFKISNSQMLYLKNAEFRTERADMQRSKLELYEDVLTALADRHLAVDAIAYACNMDCVALRQRLDFLLKNGLVEERNYNEKTHYTLTHRGLAIYKTLALTKKLEILQIKIKHIEEALQTMPSLSENRATKAKRSKQRKNY